MPEDEEDEIENCPICNDPMCFERKTEAMPHEYDVCVVCGKHLCWSCSIYDDDCTPYCPDCFNQGVGEGRPLWEENTIQTQEKTSMPVLRYEFISEVKRNGT